MNIGQLIASLGVDTKDVDTAIAKMKDFENQANKSVKSVNERLEATGRSMKQFGRNMSMYVTAPLALAGGSALNLYKDFESSMTKVNSLVGVSREVVQKWSQEILDIAPTLGKAPAELADAMFFVTSAGIRGAEAMEVLEMSAKASAAGLGETKIVADLVTSAMNAYGVSNLSAAQATDVLVATVREGKAQADALASSMGMVLPIASYMGVTFDQVGGAIAAMTRTGTNAQTASVQLRQILNSLIKPTQQAEDALVGMKTSSAELRKTIREDGLLAALMKVRELTNKYGEQTMSKVFPNIRALSGVLDIMGKNLGDNVKIFKSVEAAQGSLNKAFRETQETLEFKWNQAIVSGKVALTELGKSLKTSVVPLLARLSERIQKLTTWWASLSERQQQARIRILALTAAIGPLMIALGWLVGNVLPGLVKIGLAAVKMFNALRVAVMTNPLLVLAGALAAIGVALVTFTKRARDAKEAQAALNMVGKTAIKDTTEKRVAIENLFRIAQDETKSLEERKAALDVLNRASPEYFGNLNLETIATEKGTKAKQAYIEELIREAKVKGAMDELVRLEKERYKMIEELEGARLRFGQKVGVVLTGVLGGNMKAMTKIGQKGLENIKQVEQELDNAESRVRSILDEIITKEDIEKMVPGLDTVTKSIDAVEAAMEGLDAEIEYANNMVELMGDKFDRTQHVVDAINSTMEELVRAGVKPTADEMQRVIALFDEWQGIVEMEEDLKAIAKVYNDIEEASEKALGENTLQAHKDMHAEVRKLDEEINELILSYWGLGEASKTVFEMANYVKGAFKGMQNVITSALNSTQNVFKSFAKFFGDFIKGLIFKLIAATIAAVALAVALSFIPGMGGMTGKIFTGLGKASTFGEIFKRGLKDFGGFQKGGVVPPGFPSDSFPAMLSSGETVIPAAAGGKPVKMEPMMGEVVFKIGDDELIGILKRKVSIEENY
jgi:TP901 family phage tail tape measure protein